MYEKCIICSGLTEQTNWEAIDGWLDGQACTFYNENAFYFVSLFEVCTNTWNHTVRALLECQNARYDLNDRQLIQFNEFDCRQIQQCI